jgi:hypothetical protein
MAPNMNLPPFGWRYDTGYIHLEETPPTAGPPPGGPPFVYCPGGVYAVSVQGRFWGPPPPKGSIGFAPPHHQQTFFYPSYGYSGPPPRSRPAHAVTWPEAQQQGPPSSPETDDDETAPGYKLTGGLVPGAALHPQDGKYVCFHVLGSNGLPLNRILEGDHDGLINKRIHQFNENTSIEQVMDKLKAGRRGKMTHVHERGGGLFYKGTTFEQGGDKTKKTLKDMGWGGAGLEEKIEPIWVVVQKEGKKCG